MKPLLDHHHYKIDLIPPSDRVAQYERYVVDLLLSSPLQDSQRESSITFELKHQAGITQMARILARKRNLPIDVCSTGALLHDIYVIVEGKYKDHAHLGAPIAKEIMEKIGGFTSEEASQIHRIIYDHSDKHLWSDDPFVEFGKDADTLDSFLYPGAFGYYLRHKPLDIFSHYIKRAEKVWGELSIPQEPRFELLKNYNPEWFNYTREIDEKHLLKLLAVVLHLSLSGEMIGAYPPAFCLVKSGQAIRFNTNDLNWKEYITRLRSLPTDLQFWLDSSLIQYLDMPGDQDPVLDLHSEKIPESLIKQSKSLTETIKSEKSIILFWPAIDAYEILNGEEMNSRLKELGLFEYIESGAVR